MNYMIVIYFISISSKVRIALGRNLKINDAKFQVKTRLQSILCIFTLDEMEFLVAYGDRH